MTATTKSKPRTRLNFSGEPMQAFGAYGKCQRVMRRVRRRAERLGCLLTRFKQTYGYESEHGCAWIAFCRHNPSLAVSIWEAIGANDIEEARRTCDEIVENGTDKVIGVSWCGTWPQ